VVVVVPFWGCWAVAVPLDLWSLLLLLYSALHTRKSLEELLGDFGLDTRTWKNAPTR
jgi:hypothetical protein